MAQVNRIAYFTDINASILSLLGQFFERGGSAHLPRKELAEELNKAMTLGSQIIGLVKENADEEGIAEGRKKIQELLDRYHAIAKLLQPSLGDSGIPLIKTSYPFESFFKDVFPLIVQMFDLLAQYFKANCNSDLFMDCLSELERKMSDNLKNVVKGLTHYPSIVMKELEAFMNSLRLAEQTTPPDNFISSSSSEEEIFMGGAEEFGGPMRHEDPHPQLSPGHIKTEDGKEELREDRVVEDSVGGSTAISGDPKDMRIMPMSKIIACGNARACKFYVDHGTADFGKALNIRLRCNGKMLMSEDFLTPFPKNNKLIKWVPRSKTLSIRFQAITRIKKLLDVHSSFTEINVALLFSHPEFRPFETTLTLVCKLPQHQNSSTPKKRKTLHSEDSETDEERMSKLRKATSDEDE
jgi:hypothetical protein